MSVHERCKKWALTDPAKSALCPNTYPHTWTGTRPVDYCTSCGAVRRWESYMDYGGGILGALRALAASRVGRT